MENRATLLRRTLFTNGVVTLLFGALLLVDHAIIAALVGVAEGPVIVAGAICVAFAPVLFLAARKRELSTQVAALLVAVDGAWVAGSFVVAAAAPLTGIGRALVVAQAGLVGVFMVLETAGIRRLQASGVERAVDF